MTRERILSIIEDASRVVGKSYPLYSFVTSNPLSGYENYHFELATKKAEKLLGGNFYPSYSNFENAWKNGEIYEEDVAGLLKEHNLTISPQNALKNLKNSIHLTEDITNGDLNRITTKWLMAFIDEGQADWTMPKREKGFFNSWRLLAKYDSELNTKKKEIPNSAFEAIEQALSSYSENEQKKILESHLAALPGWAGYIKLRVETKSPWQQKYSISLEDYFAVRFCIADFIGTDISAQNNTKEIDEEKIDPRYIWLKAWEKGWQNGFIKKLKSEVATKNEKNELADAQMVFCIDTRSELIRRNIENKGKYETFGYAGFFGIAMDYKSPDKNLVIKSCPPIVPSSYVVSEKPQENKSHVFKEFIKDFETKSFIEYLLKQTKNMLPSSFGYVEGAGLLYGISLLSKTFFSRLIYKRKNENSEGYESSLQTEISYNKECEPEQTEISLEEKTAIVKSAFDLMGWTKFSPIVLFIGHGSYTANNPFDSSLDCGACAASPGRHNARMLAKLANQKEVRNELKEKHQINIGGETVFIGAEHNTTTDEIVLFDSEIPDSHIEKVLKLKKSLYKAQKTATKERLGTKNSIAIAYEKTSNWSETRPEWGLAKNAGFVVGPRSLTKNLNLEGSCFLHSYNWELDQNGAALESIMQGPMVVTQWINNHYYFATVDNNTFGAGSKVTHNVTGKFGVIQGNGGDLKTGLPLQSVNTTDEELYHNPLRLTVFINAPKENINQILSKNENLKTLVENEWIYLMVIDPKNENTIEKYNKGFNWVTQ